MRLLSKALLVAPVALLLLAGEASAQRIRSGGGNPYGGYGYGGYGPRYGGYAPYGYGYGQPGLSVGFQSGRYGVVVGSTPGYGYPAYGYSGYEYPAYGPAWSGGYAQPWAGGYPAAGYTISPSYSTGGVVQTGAAVSLDTGVVQAAATSAAAAPARLEVVVPADAEVWFDGVKSPDAGDVRKFVSKELQPGVPASFSMKVRRTGDGRDTTQEFTVPIYAGEEGRMDFRSLVD